MLTDIAYRCGHTVATSLLEIRSLTVDDQIRNRRQGICPNCQDEEQRAEGRKRWERICELNADLPPFEGTVSEDQWRRALTTRAKARYALDTTRGRLRLALEEPGVTLRTRREIEEGLLKIDVLMACADVSEWIARESSPMTSGEIGPGCERLSSGIRWRARRRR